MLVLVDLLIVGYICGLIYYLIHLKQYAYEGSLEYILYALIWPILYVYGLSMVLKTMVHYVYQKYKN